MRSVVTVALAAAGLAILGHGPGLARAQNFEGCSTADVSKLSSLGRGLMGCFGLSLAEVFVFMRSMSPDQRAWLDKCSESTGQYQSECFHLLESLMQQAASQPGSVPAKVVGNIYTNPPQVLNCAAALNKNAPAFSQTCSDGTTLARLTAASARMAPYINSIQPWHMPPQLDGCNVNDALNVQLAYLPFIDCLNLNFTQFVTGFSTGGGSMGTQLEDATVRAAIDCLYDPHISNSECMYLVILASTKLEGGGWSSVIPYAMRALTDYPQACQCVRGASASAAFSAVPKTCAAHDALEALRALEASCAFEPQIQSALARSLNGCGDADVVRAELVGVQLLDCMGATGADLAGSAHILDEARIAQLANCVHKPDYSNVDCLALLGSLVKVAANQPDSLEAQVVDRMTKDGQAFCGCVDAAAKSAPAQAIAPTCESPYGGIQFLRNNRQYCEAIAAVPPSFWSATAAAIASAAAKAGAPSPAPAPATTGTSLSEGTATTTPPGAAGLPPPPAAAEGKDGEEEEEGSYWDWVPDMPIDWPDLPSFAEVTSMLRYFSPTNMAGGMQPAQQQQQQRQRPGERLVQGIVDAATGTVEKAAEPRHQHLRFAAGANKQGRVRKYTS